ncbi:putative membrane protein [Propionispora sp. 2/2-37]|uniref:hypothetical protein n=1 Tax=Propionispora sp. 2/2-37 TaxID=1677858 RepID=UPI0006BB913D|nr:hypothetical protein [Propionispora sp. 2/2-37]CUH97152.1 putative membrane protein [Propionispora sp. 2/2-37]
MMKRWFSFLHDNWVGVILTMTLILFFVYLYAFFRNGEGGAHFDLVSCWTGVGAIATAAAAGWGKWVVDSKYNSVGGQKPDQ